MITQKINLNLIPGGVMPRVNVSQYDYGSRTLEITLYNGSSLFEIPSGVNIFIQGTKKDMRGFQYENLSYSGSVVTADITQQMTVFEDEVLVELVILKTLFGGKSEQLATANFVLNVEPAALRDNVVVSETDIPAIQTLPEAMEEIREAVRTTSADATKAENEALDSEAWAVGQRDGEDVDSEDPTYQNNSKYYSTQAANSSSSASASATTAATSATEALGHKEDSEAYAVGKRNGVDVGTTDEAYHNNSKYYSQQAQNSAGDAATSKSEAEDFAILSESWAIGGTGERSGEDTNNSMYWAGQSQTSANSAATAQHGAETAEDNAQGILDEITDLVGATVFSVDFTTGELIYDSPNYTFNINTTTGNLEWEVAV